MSEPRFRTRYEDLHKSTASSADEKQLTLIGLSTTGPMDSFMSFDGLSGLDSAEILFGTDGRLPHAIREAIQVSDGLGKPITVNALRCGEGALKASLDIYDDSTSQIVMTLEYDYYGTEGNDWDAKVETVPMVSGTVTLRDPDDETTAFTGATIAAIVDLINASSLPVTATAGPGGPTIETFSWRDFAGGLDGSLTTAEVARVLKLLEDEDYPSIVILGANTSAMHSLIGTHCSGMLSAFPQVERFAGVELETFDSTSTEKSAAWYVDVSDWASDIIDYLDTKFDRNLIPCVGQAKYLDAKGESYEANTAACVMAAWLGQSIKKSPINVQVGSVVQSLVPNIPNSNRSALADARANYVMFMKGRGYIINGGRTLAENDSDFKYPEVLRAVYVCGAEARENGLVAWGDPDDPDTHGGLAYLQAQMEKPLTTRRDTKKEISAYQIRPSIDGEGNVTATMGVTPFTTMRNVDHTVYVKRS